MDKSIKDEESHIVVCMGNLPRNFDVVDTVCDFTSAVPEIGGQVRVQDAFRLLKNKLRKAAIELGGDAVVECQFQHRGASSGGLAPAHVLELWGFGTVVKFK